MSTESDSPMLVYVGTYDEDPAEGIHRLLLDPASGSLEPAGTTPGVPTPFFIRIDAAGRRLYAANALDECDGVDQGAVSAFDLDPSTGALTFLGRQPSGGALPCYIDLAHDGRFLLTGNYNSGSVAVLPIEAGGLGPPTATAQHQGSSIDEERQEGPHVHCMVLDPTGRWALAADLGTDEVRVYGLAEGGALKPADPPAVSSRPGAGPRHIAFHPGRSIAYVLNELDSTLSVYDWDPERGRLTERQTEPALPPGFSGHNYAADVKILPSGRFLYTSNRGHDSIAVFAVDEAGGSVEIAGHEPAGGSWPWNLCIDPSARFLLAANYQSDCVSLFRIDGESGALNPMGAPAAVPKPVCLAMLSR